jgi:tryptophan-rich sensory protein
MRGSFAKSSKHRGAERTTPERRALALALLLCVAVAGLEGLIGAGGLPGWYSNLDKPGWHLSTTAFVLVAVLVYAMDGFIVYRLLRSRPLQHTRALALAMLIAVMLYNAAWNAVLFRTEDLMIGLLGLGGFLVLLSILQAVLIACDRASATVHAVYIAWVVLYDIPLYVTMWRMNE